MKSNSLHRGKPKRFKINPIALGGPEASVAKIVAVIRKPLILVSSLQKPKNLLRNIFLDLRNMLLNRQNIRILFSNQENSSQ